MQFLHLQREGIESNRYSLNRTIKPAHYDHIVLAIFIATVRLPPSNRHRHNNSLSCNSDKLSPPSSSSSPETPDVPLPIEGDQGLALLQLISAAGAIIRIVVVQMFSARRVRLTFRCRHCGRPSRRQLNVSISVSTSPRSDSHRGCNARFAEHLLTSVRHLGKNSLIKLKGVSKGDNFVFSPCCPT